MHVASDARFVNRAFEKCKMSSSPIFSNVFICDIANAWGPFYLHRLVLIPPWMGNHIKKFKNILLHPVQQYPVCITIASYTIHHQYFIQIEFTIVTSYTENTEWVQCLWVYNSKVNNRRKWGKKLTWFYGPLVWNTSDSLFLVKQRGALIATEKKKKQHINFSHENFQNQNIPCIYFMTPDNCVMNICIIKLGNSFIIGNWHKP